DEGVRLRLCAIGRGLTGTDVARISHALARAPGLPARRVGGGRRLSVLPNLLGIGKIPGFRLCVARSCGSLAPVDFVRSVSAFTCFLAGLPGISVSLDVLLGPSGGERRR